MNAEEVGELVKETRLKYGCSQVLLAKAAGVTIRTIRRVERGNPTVKLTSVYRVMLAVGLEDKFREVVLK